MYNRENASIYLYSPANYSHYSVLRWTLSARLVFSTVFMFLWFASWQISKFETFTQIIIYDWRWKIETTKSAFLNLWKGKFLLQKTNCKIACLYLYLYFKSYSTYYNLTVLFADQKWFEWYFNIKKSFWSEWSIDENK